MTRLSRRLLLAALAPAAGLPLSAPARAQTAPTLVVGVAIDTGDIAVSWAGDTMTAYQVMASSGGAFTQLQTGQTNYSAFITGLSTNTAASFFVQGSSGAFPPVNSATLDVFTLSAQPTGSALLGTIGNSVTLSWAANGDAAGTFYNVDWWVGTSTAVVFSTQAVAGSSVVATIGALPGGETINFDVQSLNAQGFGSNFDVILSTTLPAIPNQALISSGTYALGISSIAWFWSASTGAINYQLFADSGVAVSPLLGPNVLASTQTGLSPNTPYTDYVQAFGTTSSTTTAPFTRYTLAAQTTGLHMVSLSTPTATAVVAWNSINPPGTTYEVEWWTAITSTITISTQATSAIVPNLYGGATIYFTIQARNGDGILSTFDSTFAAGVFTAFPVAIQSIPAGGQGTVVFVLGNPGTSAAGSVVTVQVASGTFNAAVNFTVSTAAFQAPPGSGQTAATGEGAIAFTITANDPFGNPATPLGPLLVSVFAPNAGLAPLDQGSVALSVFDTAHNVWVPLATSKDYAGSLHAVSTRLGTFEVLGISPPTDLSSITVGPNPLRPMVNPGQLMTFRNLPPATRVRIFTYLGEKTADVNADGSGVAGWDGRNASGSFVASGVYLAVIQGGGVKKIMRVAIER